LTANGASAPADLGHDANFDELVEAYYAAKTASSTAAADGQKQQFAHVEQAFEQLNGKAVHRWFANHRQAAVILTETGNLFVTPPLDGNEADQ